MRRFSSQKRTQSWSAMGIDAIMESGGPKSPTSSTRSSRDYDTGFPEPFCGGGNTTLRHPDADTSPNACISAADIDMTRVYSRSRRSFLNKNKRTTLNYGKLTRAEAEVYNDLSPITETATRTNASSADSARNNYRLSKDSDSSNRPSSSAHSDKSLQQHMESRDNSRPTTSHSGIHPQGSILNKFRRHS